LAEHNGNNPSTELRAVVNDYSDAVEADPQAREFIAQHPEFAPGYDPNKSRRRKRNREGQRLDTYVIDPASLADDAFRMVRDLTHRTSTDAVNRRHRFAPLDADKAFRTAEDEALDRLEPALDFRDGLVDFFQEAFARLKDDHRELLEWAYFDGLSQREIAGKRGCNQSTVSRGLDAAKRALCDAIAKAEGPVPVVATGGRPRRDESAIRQQVERALRHRGLLPTPDPFRSPTKTRD
jgi:RNA polymerase sigma factor (sigma-70 family)